MEVFSRYPTQLLQFEDDQMQEQFEQIIVKGLNQKEIMEKLSVLEQQKVLYDIEQRMKRRREWRN